MVVGLGASGSLPRRSDRSRRSKVTGAEISRRLTAEGTPLNRTSVAEILTEEGFGRLLRRPAEQVSTAAATPGRDRDRPGRGRRRQPGAHTLILLKGMPAPRGASRASARRA